MVTVLLALGLFIVLMQLGLMSLVRRLAQQLELERSRIDKLERVRLGRRAEASDGADFASTLGGEPTQPAPRQAQAPAPASPASGAAVAAAGTAAGGEARLAAPAPSGPASPAIAAPARTAAMVPTAAAQVAAGTGAAVAAGVAGSAAEVSGAQRVDPAELRGEMLGLMRQLVDQGLSVREIASRCGLSEAEAELMLSLHGAGHA
ncbi:MAG: DUF2802 domain-containing protein [Betaproteobacteria bacterium]|nr:DUF2802 domain-containing protein [Betaproteobacteria bacterium]